MELVLGEKELDEVGEDDGRSTLRTVPMLLDPLAHAVGVEDVAARRRRHVEPVVVVAAAVAVEGDGKGPRRPCDLLLLIFVAASTPQ